MCFTQVSEAVTRIGQKRRAGRAGGVFWGQGQVSPYLSLFAAGPNATHSEPTSPTEGNDFS